MNPLTRFLFKPLLAMLSGLAVLLATLATASPAHAQQITKLWEAPAGMSHSPDVLAWQTQHQAWWNAASTADDCLKLAMPALDPTRPTYAFAVKPGRRLLRPVVYVQDYLAQDVWISGMDALGCPFLKHAGRHVNFDRREILSPYPNFSLPLLQSDSQTVVLVQDTKGKVPTLGVMEATEFTRQSVNVFFGIGVVATTLMTILIISAVFFLRQKVADIRANLTFTACLWLWMLQTYSLGESFIPLWPGSEFFGLMQGLAAGSVILSAGWCVTQFADLGPRFRSFYLGGVVFAGALFFVAHVVEPIYPWAQSFLLISTTVTVWVVLKAMLTREPVKLFYGLGFMSFIAGSMLQTAAQTMFNDALGLRADFGLPIGAVLLTVFWLIATVFLVRQQREQELKQLMVVAGTDKLTGLWNRDHLSAQIQQRLHVHPLPREGGICVLLLDLDNFKLINDTQGHQQGDALLKEVARRIQSTLQAHWGERAMAGRFGGDEFVVMIEAGATLEAKQALAQALMSWISQPVMLQEREVKVGVSIGFVTCNDSYERAEDLIRDADIAMYEAKKRGRAQAVMFEPHMQMWVQERYSLEVALAQAIDKQAFELHFQPIVNLQTGEHAGLEALVRWNCPQRGMVSPADFIPLAEENGMIEAIGRQVLEMAMQAVAHWKKQGLWREGWYVSVNVSGRQLSGVKLFDEMMALLNFYQLKPQDLRLELTESAVIANLDAANTELPRINHRGVALCMDDFGTGYSSLSYLSRLPFNVLKIDRSFMEDIAVNEARQALIRTVLTLARDMKLQVVAEGVERAEQRDWLSSMACDFGQGYLFSKPLSALDAQAWLEHANDATMHPPTVSEPDPVHAVYAA